MSTPGTIYDVPTVDHLLAQLDAEQVEAVKTPAGPLCISAGAGTGKTTALVARIAYLVDQGQWDASKVLAVTHSSKAAGNLRDRLARVADPRLRQVTAKTFHAAALMICRQNWSHTGREHDLALAENVYPIVRSALRKIDRTDADKSVVTDLVAEIGWAKASCVTPTEYAKTSVRAGRRVESRTAKQVAEIFAAYQKELLNAGKVDFSDLLEIASTLIEEIPAVAAGVRASYRHILVDEFQDTDPAQDRFMRAVLGESNDVTVVGDERQAIYSFKGSTVELLRNFPARFPGTRVVHLVRDYRSSPQIVAAANVLQPAGEHGLVGHNTEGPEPALLTAPDESSEAGAVAALVARSIRSGTPPSQIAVLYRFNAQSAPFEQALAQAGVPYTVLDNEKFFDRPEIIAVLRDAWAEMSRQEQTTDHPFGPSDTVTETGPGLLRRVLERSGFDRDNPPSTVGAARDRWEALNALLELTESQTNAEQLTPRQTLSELALRRSESHTVTTQTVTLSTLHKAKGLEWEMVVLPRAVEGSLPSAYATTVNEIEEERRLVYVGVTRAAKTLVFSYAIMRGTEKRRWPAVPSRFLDELKLYTPQSQQTGSARPGTHRKPPALTKSVLLDPTERRIFEDLRAWRRTTAKAAGVPEFIVFSDATLEQIAKKRPGSRTELLAVSGIGGTKADSYGAGIFAVLSQFN